ncbi:hypothetical protein AX16_000303 [Volvariella volvacea WC 439]|nr:hypothetical protein AX16_000303 [Volvariella volvacea WC 439]
MAALLFADMDAIVLVTRQIIRKLSTETPSPELVNAYISEIAKAYGVPWNTPTPVDVGQEQKLTNEDTRLSPPVLGIIYSWVSAFQKSDVDVAPKDDEKSKLSSSESGPKLPDLPPTEESKPTSPAPPPSTTNGAGTAPSSTVKESTPKEEDNFDALAKRFAALKKR